MVQNIPTKDSPTGLMAGYLVDDDKILINEPPMPHGPHDVSTVIQCGDCVS